MSKMLTTIINYGCLMDSQEFKNLDIIITTRILTEKMRAAVTIIYYFSEVKDMLKKSMDQFIKLSRFME